MTADTWPKKAETQYFALAGYAEMRQSVLAGMLQPYVAVTDLYGKLICEVTLILGQSQPETTVIINLLPGDFPELHFPDIHKAHYPTRL